MNVVILDELPINLNVGLCCLCFRWRPEGGDAKQRNGGGEGADGGAAGVVQSQLGHFQKHGHLALHRERVQAGEEMLAEAGKKLINAELKEWNFIFRKIFA